MASQEHTDGGRIRTEADPKQGDWDVEGNSFTTLTYRPYWHEAHHTVPSGALGAAIELPVHRSSPRCREHAAFSDMVERRLCDLFERIKSWQQAHTRVSYQAASTLEL